MALAHNKKISMFLEPMLELQGRKGNVKAPTGTLKGEDNALNSSLDNVRSLCKQGRLKEALHILNAMDQRVDNSIYASLLQLCINQKSLSEGKSVHIHMNERGFMADTFLANTLVNMYTKCGSLVDARRVFDDMTKRDAFSWTVMIAAYSKHGLADEALRLFHQMQRTDVQPNHFTYASILPACADLADLQQGMEIHEEIIRSGFQSHVFVANTLIDMYAKCGRVGDARNLFDKMPQRDVVSWNVMIAAYTRHGSSDEALTLFHQMQRTGILSNEFTFASVLPACAHLVALDQGIEIHEEIIRRGFQSDAFVESALVDMYTKCRCFEKARHLFDKMSRRDVVSWNSMIAGYAQNGHVDEALNLFQKMPNPNVVSWTTMIAGFTQNGQSVEALKIFRQMQLARVNPDTKTFACILPACANLAALEQGMEIHDEINKKGFQSDVFVQSALVDMYAKCGNIKKARDLFDKMPQRVSVSWNTMITGYAQNGRVDEALKLFWEMPSPDVVTWNAIIAGCTQNGQGEKSLKIFQQMQLAGVKADSKTFASVLPACTNLAAPGQGMEIHEQIIRSGFQSDPFVESALVDMYAKCGCIEKARSIFNKMHQRNTVSWTAMVTGYAQNGSVDEALKLFKEMPTQDVVSWTAMIAGYVQNGHGLEALNLFQQMQLAGVKPNSNTFASVLPACANLAALEQGMEIHEDIIRCGFQSDVFVESALVDMYAKCGSITMAQELFDKMHERDAISWTAMIAGYAMHGRGKDALQLFEQMQHSGVKPTHATLVCVLSACCHAGLVDEGQKYFDCMSHYYNISPAMEHYVCMVDLLGRAGHLDEALDFISKMPIKPNSTVWSSLLGACRTHNDMELGERVAESLFELDPKNATPYVLLSNIYAAAGRWNDSGNVRRMMKDRRIKKMPGCSWIEVNKQVHVFLVGDRSHPQTEQIYAKLERLCRQMKVAGYVPDTRFVLRDVDDEQKEQIIFHHSEKLAIVFGIINMSPGTVIRVIKNLRVCSDCHSATKFISKILGREILVRDANRFHHFKDGKCSCGDYW
eukprot:Gb_32452 [translate_table: standard]